MTTLIIAALVIGIVLFFAAILAIAICRSAADYDGMEFEELPKQHPIWRDEE